MATIKILLGILCFAFIGSNWSFGGNLLRKRHPADQHFSDRRLLEIARAELNVREATGNNDGKRVAEYLAAVGLKRPEPWCAAFVSWVFKQAGYARPRTGWSPSLFPERVLAKAAVPGNVFGIYFPALKRIAHCGFVEQVKGDWIGTIEGNTNVAGSREGDGVYRRFRHIRTIGRFADWSVIQQNKLP